MRCVKVLALVVGSIVDVLFLWVLYQSVPGLVVVFGVGALGVLVLFVWRTWRHSAMTWHDPALSPSLRPPPSNPLLHQSPRHVPDDLPCPICGRPCGSVNCLPIVGSP